MNKIIYFLRFLKSIKTVKSIKDDYVRELCFYILDKDVDYYHFKELENIRKALLSNDNLISILDMGAGSSYSNSSTKKISEVAKQQLSKPYQLQVISRLVQYTNAQTCLELGASLGLSSFYMAKSTKGTVTSLEGNPAFIDLINYQKKLLNITNLTLVEGNFDATLKKQLEETKAIDFAFIDGNHRKDATIEYFNLIKDKCSEKAILVFDDIYWSKGMFEAWTAIKNDKSCTSSIDLYFMGIVFLDKSIHKKEDIKLSPKKWF